MRQKRKHSGSRSKRSSYDGYLHEKDGRMILIGIAMLGVATLPLVILVNSSWIYMFTGLYIGAYCGYIITPDADHMGTTHEEYRAMRKFRFFGSLLVAWMVPYAYLFRHRSMASHSVFPGTPIRFLWFTWPLLIIAIWIVIDLGLIHSAWYPIMLIGWSIQDMFHYKRDGLGWLGLKDRRIPRKA